jgi:hypothetical protein
MRRVDALGQELQQVKAMIGDLLGHVLGSTRRHRRGATATPAVDPMYAML